MSTYPKTRISSIWRINSGTHFPHISSSSSKSLLYVTFRYKRSFKWHCNTIKQCRQLMRWMMYRWWCEGGGDRAWWVIESVFLRSPDKGFWACLGDIPPDMPRRPETWVSLYNLMMKLCGISRSSAILGSDSPKCNNRKDHSLWVTPFISRERPNVKHAIAGYLRLPRPTSAPALMRVLHWLCSCVEEPG